MKPKVYIDGNVGTTGLRIHEWLAGRSDLELVSVPEKRRKDPELRKQYLGEADVAILCLPEEASREAALWARDAETRLIDASTAHRVADGWTYGLPELIPEQRELIRVADRVSNPGCYASAFLLLVRPLVEKGLINRDAPVLLHALSGYSGGGRAMIEKWEGAEHGLVGLPFEALYALDRVHKHIAEMMHFSELRHEPQFVPAVGPFRCGMRVEIPLHSSGLPREGAREVWRVLSERYAAEPFVRVKPLVEVALEERALDPRSCNDSNRIDLTVAAHPSGHTLLVAILDNLGKGAAGVAVQNLNLMVGIPEHTGLSAGA